MLGPSPKKILISSQNDKFFIDLSQNNFKERTLRPT
jgi:hypothetical protein